MDKYEDILHYSIDAKFTSDALKHWCLASQDGDEKAKECVVRCIDKFRSYVEGMGKAISGE